MIDPDKLGDIFTGKETSNNIPEKSSGESWYSKDNLLTRILEKLAWGLIICASIFFY